MWVRGQFHWGPHFIIMEGKCWDNKLIQEKIAQWEKLEVIKDGIMDGLFKLGDEALEELESYIL